MAKSKLDKNQQGAYDVRITGQMPHSTAYHEHSVHVESAKSPRDALNQAEAGLNPNLNVVKFCIVFLGGLILVALSQGWIVF